MARRKPRGVAIDGWLVIDKPRDITSAHAVAITKRLTKARKAGHGGTLDPLATGVLPIALGQATKTVSFVMDGKKRYRFVVRFGEARDTDDAQGALVASSELRPDDRAIEAALPAFIGTIAQRPPDYAAVKIDGERAYDLARRGEAVQLEAREVTIDSFALKERLDGERAVFEAVCGKGSYVRALARDLGAALGCFGHVEALRRLSVGPFTTEAAITLDGLREIVDNDSLPQVLVPVSTALADIPALAVTEPQASRLRSGQTIRVSPRLIIGEARDGCTIKAISRGDLVALARFEEGELSPMRIFQHPDDATRGREWS